jgi:hypothetical protein
VLTVLADSERLVETLAFHEVDVTVDRNRRASLFQGVRLAFSGCALLWCGPS